MAQCFRKQYYLQFLLWNLIHMQTFEILRNDRDYKLVNSSLRAISLPRRYIENETSYSYFQKCFLMVTPLFGKLVIFSLMLQFPTHFMMVLHVCIIVSELCHKLFSLMICILRIRYINLCAT